MAAACGLLHQLPQPSKKPLKTSKLVAFIVRRPCCSCWLVFSVAILASVIGLQIVLSNSGPLGPFKLGVDYPSKHPLLSFGLRGPFVIFHLM